MNTFLDEFLQLLSKSEKILLSLHKNPDGDSVGSNLAMAQVLKSMGKEVEVITPDNVPSYLQFLLDATKIQPKKAEDIDFSSFDLFIALDMSAPDMMKLKEPLPSSLPIVCIDHHATNKNWGLINYVEAESISTASVLQKLFEKMESGVSLNMTGSRIGVRDDKYKEIVATCLLAGLATDSGFFQYNRDAQSFATAAKLVEAGADYQKIVFEVNKQVELSDYQFVGSALENLEVAFDKFAFITIPHALWEKYCKEEDRTYLLKSYIQNIKGTEAGAILTETAPGEIKVSLRARNRAVDVAAIAEKLGGGGHKAAAGANILGKTLPESVQIVAELLRS